MRARLSLLAILAVGVAGCSKAAPDAPGNTNTGGSTTISIASLDPGGSSASDYDANGKLVNGYGSAFMPPTLTVTTGTTVTWKNNDSVVHEPISDAAGMFDGRLDPSGTLNVTFATAGTYTYHCKIHPELTGTITVE